jgi:glycosyltransferase 2 family protein
VQTKNILIQTLQKIWKVISDHRSWISAVVLIFAFTFIGIALWRGWVQIGPYIRQTNFSQMVIAEGFIAVALILGVATWHFIQKAYELGLSGFESARAHFASSVTRYIPGYAWQYMSKAYLSGGNHENLSNVSMALLTEFIILILGGFFLLGLFSIIFPTIPEANLFSPIIWMVISVAGLLGIIAWFGFSLGFLKWNHNVLKKSYFIFWALLCSLIGWISFGLANWYVIFAFTPTLSFQTFPQVQFAVIASMLLSILIIFVPGGIGVRESALAFLLQGILPLSMGIVISIMLRIGIILGELVSFLFISKGLRSFFAAKKTK